MKLQELDHFISCSVYLTSCFMLWELELSAASYEPVEF